ncbi:Crp/Fnr family transcriptional regulator [Hoeflea prorocentri]|uniref:Crp/Fnr family transcriptional regulator n=1 Tax=Hoeflea prorocentri TaxID=1922333 RepID=A0A9X3UJ28_9HYPH|nr:Crp/Fnr family transcriptional regulator [Hoeflea prorocentri]MCY6381350.1 Crp/Fnr family transcriptional regulator [Hoeflea prorocentri]MDA5399150.1 Crp/Fnr family transcriptional regulator [Hoeflea prorocentri]
MTEKRRDIHNSEMPALCQACEARHHGMCGSLTPDELTQLNKIASRKEVSAGTALVADSEAVTHYSNILSGVVKLTKILSDGRQQIVGLQFAPDFLGRPFKTSSETNAESATTVRLCSFPRSAVDRMIEDSPSLEHRLLQQTLNELDEARGWMVTLGRKTAAEKVASFLYLIATHINPESDAVDGVSFELPLTRADIADFLGLTIETVSRQMTKLRKDGVVEIENNRHVTVPDLERLAHRASI